MATNGSRSARRARHRLGLVALTAVTLLVSGCGAKAASDADGSAHTGPKVVAASTWEAAYAEAAGATDVQVIVPSTVSHAPDYDPKPSDLLAVADADYVLYAPFEGFVDQLKSATGSKAKLVELNLDNSPANVTKEVDRLGKMFGTQDAATAWDTKFDAEWKDLSAKVKAAWPDGKQPSVVSQVFVGYAAQLAGAKVLGTYGPMPPTAQQVATLEAKKPEYVLDNTAMHAGEPLPGSGATTVMVSNYPGDDLDMLAVYQATADALIAAFKG